MKKTSLFSVIFLYCFSLFSQQTDSARIKNATKGIYFSKKEYKPTALPKWENTKDLLPKPIYENNPVFSEMYYKAWSIAFQNFYEPTLGSGFVSQYADAAFNENMFLWDGSFITMFSNYGFPFVPGISGLDNFYCKQYPDGEICREIIRATGNDYPIWNNWENRHLFSRWQFPFEESGRINRNAYDSVIYINREKPKEKPFLTFDALDHPILAWAEIESYKITGNKERLKMVYSPLKKYYEALHKFILQGNGLYMTDWASMDDSPRNKFIRKGGTAIDISCEMVLFANNLSEMARLTGNYNDTTYYKDEAQKISKAINKKMWNKTEKFYYDLTYDEKLVPIKTIAGFWTLISGVASIDQANYLVKELNNKKTFNRPHRVPVLAATEKSYHPLGDYWNGSVWAPTNTMVIRGLEKYNFNTLAYEIAMNHLNCMAEVFKKTNTIWENYAPDSILPGNPSRKDFVGWSGMAPVLYFLEYAIGLKPDASTNSLTWNVRENKKVGCENYNFNNHKATIIAENVRQGSAFEIKVISDGTFGLIVNCYGKTQSFQIQKGEQKIKFTN